MYCRAVTPRDHKEFYVLAYKSFVEREDVGIDFNETVFNQIVKNTLVHESHHIQGLFEDDIMVGFCVVMLDKIPSAINRWRYLTSYTRTWHTGR